MMTRKIISHVALSFLCCAAFLAANVRGENDSDCGRPSASHPASLIVRGGKLADIAHGIVGGAEAAPHSYPWQAQVNCGGDGGWLCGGTVLSDTWLLTAAHCLAKDGRRFAPSECDIVMGGHELFDDGATTMKAAELHPREEYFASDIGNFDIAAVKLPRPVAFSDKIRPICLPSATDNFRTDGERLVISGWGSTGSDYGWQLQHAVVETDMSRCAKKYGDKMAEDDMCAGGNGRDTCQGDSGGPAAAYRNGRFVLAGVVARGAGCGLEGWAGLYAHVPYFRQWIQQLTGV